MNNLNYITPEEYWKKYHIESDGYKSFDEVEKIAKRKPNKCSCGEDEWKLAGTGMCFTCTTGEADASEDLELTWKT